MNATLSLEGILQMLQSLSTDNKRWLAEKLYQSVEEEEEHLTPYTMEEIYERIRRSEEDIAAGRTYSSEEVHRQMREYIESL